MRACCCTWVLYGHPAGPSGIRDIHTSNDANVVILSEPGTPVGAAVAGVRDYQAAWPRAAKNPASPPVWKNTMRCWRV